jgi:hypothetical protein
MISDAGAASGGLGSAAGGASPPRLSTDRRDLLGEDHPLQAADLLLGLLAGVTELVPHPALRGPQVDGLEVVGHGTGVGESFGELLDA